MFIVQINPFGTNPIYSETGSQSFRFGVKIFSQSALAGVGGEGDFFFYEGLKPLSAGLKTPFVCLFVSHLVCRIFAKFKSDLSKIYPFLFVRRANFLHNEVFFAKIDGS